MDYSKFNLEQLEVLQSSFIITLNSFRALRKEKEMELQDVIINMSEHVKALEQVNRELNNRKLNQTKQ